MRRRTKESGFTLLEVAMSMSCAAVLAMGVMMAFSTSNVQDRGAYEVTRNQNVCVAMMEQIEALPFGTLELLADQQLMFPIDRWLFTVKIVRVSANLLSIETTVEIPAEPNQTIRLATMRAEKQEV